MMQGEAGGDGGRVRRNTRKRDLDDAHMSKTVENLSSKRRLTTTGTTGQDDDEITRKSTSQPPKPQPDTLQFSSRSSERPAPPQMHRPFNPPFSNDLAARLSGPPGATGAHWGSGYGHPKSNHNPLTTQPRASSTNSSDASSIPPRSNRILPSPTPKHETRASLHSLIYGVRSVNGAAAEEHSHNAKSHQEVKGSSHNTRRGATGTQIWQSEGRDEALPVSRINGTKELPHAITSSDDGSYVEEKEEAQDSDDDAFPTTRQRSARPCRKTPSGKDYHKLPDTISNEYSPKFALFPDGYSLKSALGRKTLRFPCPVRTCLLLCRTLEKLDNHFKCHHGRSEFNDNLDKDATLEYIRPRAGDSSSLGPIVVSQNPRHRRKFASDEKEKWASDPQLDDSSSSGNTKKDSAATAPSELDRAMAESKVWAYVAPLVPKSWAASIPEGLEKRAFIQAISLPLKNEMDMEWLAGTKGSNQRLYRALMSVIFQAVGVVAHCTPCDSRIPERRRNCKALPPEAAGMQELQQVYGSQCMNCFFFQASKPCEFPDSSTTKQTPIPVPVPPVPRTIPVIKHSHNSPPSKNLQSTATNRQFIPPYSLYKTQKTKKPISESPVPIPSFAIQGPNRQSQLQDSPDISPQKTDTKPLRQSNHITKADNKVRNSSSAIKNYTTDKSQMHSVSPDTSNNRSLNTTFTSSRSNAETLTQAASNLSSGDISTSRLASRMFSLFGDIGRLPSEEQAVLWHQMQQMSAMLQSGGSRVLKASGTQNTPTLLPGPSAAADEWEIAPGKLVVDGRPMAFSASFLRRDVISVTAAQQLSPNHRVLIKSIAALHQLPIEPEKGWKCTISVIRGVLKMKAGDVEARIGQGGSISVEKKCIITNVLHKEATMQVCWVEEV